MVKKLMKKMDEKLEKLAKEIGQCGPATRGSIVLIGMKTKQYYLSVKIKEKTKLVFLGKKRVEKAKVYLKNYNSNKESFFLSPKIVPNQVVIHTYHPPLHFFLKIILSLLTFFSFLDIF
jgi:hypothetical protein